jgi:hypothetical protein
MLGAPNGKNNETNNDMSITTQATNTADDLDAVRKVVEA